jgi:hypothetical protein
MFMKDHSRMKPTRCFAMRRHLLVLAMLLGSFALISGAAQIPEEIKSGPQRGEFLPGAFHYLNINGAHAGSPHCVVCEDGLRPTVAVFTHQEPGAGKPIAALLQKLDAAIAKYHDAELRGFVVFLSDDYRDTELRSFVVHENEEAAKNEESRKVILGKLEKFVLDTNLKNLVVCVGPATGPEKYNINKDADATVLLYRHLKVVENYTLPKGRVNERYTNAILTSVDQLVGAKKQ